MRGRFLYVPLDVLTQPASGECLIDMYWAVHPEKGAAFWCVDRGYLKTEQPAPQCNKSKSIAEHVNTKLHPECETKFLSIAYLQHAKHIQRKTMPANAAR